MTPDRTMLNQKINKIRVMIENEAMKKGKKREGENTPSHMDLSV